MLLIDTIASPSGDRAFLAHHQCLVGAICRAALCDQPSPVSFHLPEYVR
jgi:hypothetical protein